MTQIRLAAALALTLLMAACSGGSSPTSPSPTPAPSPAPAPAPTSGTLSGVVRDSVTGQPVAGVSVAFLDGPNASKASVTTDGNGAFSVPATAFGTFSVKASKDDYTATTQAVTMTGDTSLSLTVVRNKIALTGTWACCQVQLVVNNGLLTYPLVVGTITQSGTTISGVLKWQVPSTNQGQSSVTFSGILSDEYPMATFKGTMTLSTPSSTGGVICTASGLITTGLVQNSNRVTFANQEKMTYANCLQTVSMVGVSLSR